MRCGISTACFYPETTVESLRLLAENGVKLTEIFINTFSELENWYVDQMTDITKAYGIKVDSVHPFTAIMEGNLFASKYESRFWDGVAIYRRYFEVCNKLGADKLVFHGDHDFNLQYCCFEEYAENYCKLAEVAREYCVTLCHENVAYCRLGTAENVKKLRPLLGDYAAFVLDIKQVRRKKERLDAMLDAMAGAIHQVHISDYTPGNNCLPPGDGEMDYPWFIEKLRTGGYIGNLIIELYSDNFCDTAQLVRSMEHLAGLMPDEA